MTVCSDLDVGAGNCERFSTYTIYIRGSGTVPFCMQHTLINKGEFHHGGEKTYKLSAGG
jgi:hypothetical protein